MQSLMDYQAGVYLRVSVIMTLLVNRSITWVFNLLDSHLSNQIKRGTGRVEFICQEHSSVLQARAQPCAFRIYYSG